MKDLLRKVNIPGTLKAGFTAAILFSIPAFVYIKRASYSSSWLLYLGSFLFLVTIWLYTFNDSSKRQHSESTVALAFASHAATITGIIFAVAIAFILLSIMIPGYLSAGPIGRIQTGEPVTLVKGRTDGLSFEVFFAATIINFSVGSFTGIVLPFAVKRNQKRDSREPAPLHQHGKK